MRHSTLFVGEQVHVFHVDKETCNLSCREEQEDVQLKLQGRTRRRAVQLRLPMHLRGLNIEETCNSSGRTSRGDLQLISCNL